MEDDGEEDTLETEAEAAADGNHDHRDVHGVQVVVVVGGDVVAAAVVVE